MRDNKLFPSNLQNNGLIGNRKDGSKNPSKLPNINQSVRMGDSVLSHDSEAAKRISQDLTLKFMKSASRTDGRKLANKSEISQNEKDVDNKTLRGHEAEIKQPNNVVPSVPKNEPVAEIKPKENPPVPLPVIEHSDNKGGENIKSDLVKPRLPIGI